MLNFEPLFFPFDTFFVFSFWSCFFRSFGDFSFGPGIISREKSFLWCDIVSLSLSALLLFWLGAAIINLWGNNICKSICYTSPTCPSLPPSLPLAVSSDVICSSSLSLSLSLSLCLCRNCLCKLLQPPPSRTSLPSSSSSRCLAFDYSRR